MIYRFSEYELDTRSFQLARAGSPVAIEPQVFDLLKYLIINRERLISRDELFDEIWSGRVVSDTSLSNHIKSARKAVGDDGKNQGTIKTVHGRGYQFIAKTDEVLNHGSDLAALPVDDGIGNSENSGPSVAVLPFQNMSDDPEQAYFSDGISEDIITDLSKVSSLFVVARNSSFAYRNRDIKIQEICADMGVRYVVEGSVRKAGSKVRITAQLIDGKNNGQLWADRYDGTLDDIFELQDQVTCQIVDALKVRLLPNEKQAIHQVPTTNIEAYDHYLKGRQSFHILTKESLLEARNCFMLAINSDESYAQAYCGLADSMSFLGWNHGGDYLTKVQAIVAADKAIKLAPDLADGHASLGIVLSIIGEFAGAESEFKIAVQLDPNLYEAHYYWGRACFTEGKLKESAEHFETAWKLSPTDPQTPYLLQSIYRSLGQMTRLQDAALETVKLSIKKLEAEPNNWRSCLAAATGYSNLGKFHQSAKFLQRTLVNNPDDMIVNYNVACIYCTIGKIEMALKYLKKYLQQGGGHKIYIKWMENDSDLDPLRDNPEFQDLLEVYA